MQSALDSTADPAIITKTTTPVTVINNIFSRLLILSASVKQSVLFPRASVNRAVTIYPFDPHRAAKLEDQPALAVLLTCRS